MRRSAQHDVQLGRIEQGLGYKFRNPRLLRQALVHRSYAHEAKVIDHNEPLEFLGDAVLSFLVAERIVVKRPDLDEGGMTRLRASLVNTRSLAKLAQQLGLGECLLLGRGEERSGGRTKPSLLADVFEAVVGAVLLDGGIRPSRSLVHRLFAKDIDKSVRPREGSWDPKTRLQEWVQARGWDLPEYRLAEERGPNHAREFLVEVVVNGKVVGVGSGTAKKRAEQEAAAAALLKLEDQG